MWVAEHEEAEKPASWRSKLNEYKFQFNFIQFHIKSPKAMEKKGEISDAKLEDARKCESLNEYAHAASGAAAAFNLLLI
jgi:hypothetical protein